ncbi:MAG TPA: tetratricopeptide repeat protein [Rhizomicrobium sp.]|nr:tetratricopeptide repeat protein [Rhizomicrobium sp.]
MAGLDTRSILIEAVRLHQTGQLEQAAALYRKVLTADPHNADALHLLGRIALQQGQAKTAAELIRKAIARNDREESYHFHLALALQTLNDLQGAVASYRRALALKPNSPDSYNNMGNALAALDKPEEAVAAFHRALVLQPGDAMAHNNLGNVQRSMGLWDDAEASFRKAAALEPGFAGAFVNLGNLHRDKDDLRAAESCYRRAITLAPRDTAAYCGLGATLWQLGRHDEALASYQAALDADPDHAQTLVNLGIAREEQGALEEAEALYARALAVCPRDPNILNHLASARLARGDGASAIEAIRHSLTVQETPWARKLFVELARYFDWRGGGDDEIRRIIVRALTEPWDRPGALARACARLIRSHPAIGPLVMRADAAWSSDNNGRLSLAKLLGDAGFTPLADDAVLAALLISAPNTDIPLERFLTMLRGAMIRELAHNSEASAQAQTFAAALAQQCFINDYVFASDADELAAAAATARAVEEMADSVTPMQLLLAAAYFPLHGLANAEKLLERSWPAPVEAVLTQQMREPLAELRLRADIPRLTGIEKPVSQLVQNQYEENPYPRWVRPAPDTPGTLGNFLGSKFPFVRFERPAGSAVPDILIAGCGTGQRSIAMARKFGDRNMLAVDLSLASLGYARRKSEELGLTVAYAQADILELERDMGGRQFDLIESLGVLHHLADPWAGWATLLSLLRPGGFMLLGLYSEMARRPVLAARARIAELGLGGSAEDIRSFRQELIQSDDPRAYASILEAEDFFSLSACRDLLFHVQEQRVSLAQIAHFTQSNDLRLLGFELDDAVLAAYRKRFPQDMAATDLACWEAFEADHPGLFAGMYIFWVQKPSGRI